MHPRDADPATAPDLRRRPIAFVDLETTGATIAADRITEIGIVEISVGPDEQTRIVEWSSLVNPGVPIGDFIERLTGINDEMLADAPDFATIAGEVLARLTGRLLVAHNARFDYGFLQQEFKRIGIRFRTQTLCSVKLSRRLAPQHRRHGLDALVARHGLQVANRHRALADARIVCQLWQQFAREHVDFAKVVDELTASPVLPPGIDDADVESLPEGHGVCVFRDQAGAALLVVEARQLRSRILGRMASAMRQGSGRDAQIFRRTHAIEGYEAHGEVDAALIAARLRSPPRNTESFSWRLPDPTRPLTELVATETAGFTADQPLFGLFASPREARRALRRLLLAHGLGSLGMDTGSATTNGSMAGCPGEATAGAASARSRAPRVAEQVAELAAALAPWQLRVWPFAGPALLRDGDATHVVDRWRDYGRAENMLEGRKLRLDPTPAPPKFDPETYRVLVRFADRLEPIVDAKPLECAEASTTR